MSRDRVTRAALLVVVLAGCGGIGDAQKRLRTAIDAKQDTLDACYAKSLGRDAGGKGSMELLLHVAGDGGQVDSVKITSSDLADPKLEKCVKSTLKAVQLDPAPASAFDIEYTLEFGPETADSKSSAD